MRAPGPQMFASLMPVTSEQILLVLRPIKLVSLKLSFVLPYPYYTASVSSLTVFYQF